MRLVEAIRAFLTTLTLSADALAEAKGEIKTLREENNTLRTENATLKGESAEALELLETAVDLNGPIDELAQMVIDSDEIETPAALEDPAIGDAAIVTPATVAVEAAKAIAASVAETEDIDADADELADESDAE